MEERVKDLPTIFFGPIGFEFRNFSKGLFRERVHTECLREASLGKGKRDPVPCIAQDNVRYVLQSAFQRPFEHVRTETTEITDYELYKSGMTRSACRDMKREEERTKFKRMKNSYLNRIYKRRDYKVALRRNVLSGVSKVLKQTIAEVKANYPLNLQWSRKSVLRKGTEITRIFNKVPEKIRHKRVLRRCPGNKKVTD